MTRFKIPDLLPGTGYAIQVRAVGPSTVSEWSQQFLITTDINLDNPLTPTSVSWVASGDSFHAEWDAVSMNIQGGLSKVVSYEVELKSGATTRYDSVITQDAGKVVYDLGFEQNRAFFGTPKPSIDFRVRAVDNANLKSAWSAPITGTNPVPGAPTSVVATKGLNLVSVTWVPPTDVDVIGYNVYLGAGKLTFINATSYNYTTTTYAPTALTIKAVDVFLQESLGTTSNTVTPDSPFISDTTAPSVPAITSAVLSTNSIGSASALTVTWTLTPVPSDLQGFQIRYRKTGDTNWSQANATRDDTNIVITGLVPYVAYEVQARAADFSANYSAWSATTTATANSNTAPAQVTGLGGTVTNDSITMSWAENTEADVANGAGVYEVQVATDTGFTTGLLNYTTGAASITVAGLTPSTTYYVRVRARDNGGLVGPYSATNTKVLTVAPITSLSDGNPPSSSPAASVLGGVGNLNVSWTPVVNADLVTYEVHISTTSTFTPTLGAATKAAEVMGTNVTLEKDAAGTPLAYGTTYYVRIIAKDRDTTSGNAPAAGTVGSDTIKQTTASDLNVTIGGGNLLTNSSFEDSTTFSGWGTNSGTTNLASSTTQAFDGTRSVAWTPAAGNTILFRSLATTAGNTYTFSTWLYPTVATTATLKRSQSSPTGGASVVSGTPVALAANKWARVVFTSTTPAGETATNFIIDSSATGSIIYVDATQVELGDLATAYSAKPDEILPGTVTGGMVVPGTFPTTTQFNSLSTKVDSSVKTYATEYSVNASETVAPTTGWSTATPTRTPGTFIWYRVTVTNQDNTTSTTSPALLTGNTGAAGAPGTPAATVDLTATTQVLTSPSGGGATNPATAVVTGSAVNTTITAWTYSVDGAAFSATVPAGVSRTGNVVTITGSTMTARTITVMMADAAGINDTLTVAKVLDGAAGATGGTGGTGPAGADAYTVILTNEAQTFAAGTTSANAGSTTTSVIAYKGTVQQTATIGTITGQVTGLTTAITNNGTNNATVTVTVTSALVTPTGTLTIPVTVGGVAFTKTFSWSLSFTGTQGTAGTPGSPGAPASDISLTATSQILASPSAGGATNPTTTTVTGVATNTTISVYTYSVDGGAFSGTVPAGVSRTGNVVTITGSTMTARTIAVRMADAGTTADTLTVAKTFDGATGATGGTGGTGAAGADAYTVILSNEAQVFPGSTNAALAGTATTSVIAYKAAVQQAATIGTITGQVTGLTTAITNNGTNTPTVTVTLTTALTQQSGTLTIPVTVGGLAFTKTFAWSVSYVGAAGATGTPGAPGSAGAAGIGISSIGPYFNQTAAGAAAPATPTASPPPAPWVSTEPGYLTNTDLWRTERIIYSDATFAYTTPSKVSAYTAATQAMTAANGKNTITYSANPPVNGTNTGILGDTWFVRATPTANITAQYELTTAPSTWSSKQMDNAIIAANLDAAKITAGFLAAARIQGGTIDATKLNVTVGGGNLVLDSSFESGTVAGFDNGGSITTIANVTTSPFHGGKCISSTPTTALTATKVARSQNLNAVLPLNTVITMSAWVKVPVGVSISIGLENVNSGSGNYAGTGNWMRVAQTFTTPAVAPGAGMGFLFRIVSGTLAVGTPMYIDAVQVEIGDVATAYSPKSDEILPGTITANMISTGAITADMINTGTLGAVTITVPSNGQIKSADYVAGSTGFQLKSGSLEIRSGIINANTIVSGTGIVNNLIINTGGSIQSSAYTAGSVGFRISNTGIELNDANSSVKADAIKAGTITAATINIGATGTLNVDSTGQIKSNNYTANSTGYRLSSAGLEINDGTIDAKAIKSSSIAASTITMASTGVIQSANFGASAGWKLDSAGLTINQGAISAATLQLQFGENLIRPEYADFEGAKTFYETGGVFVGQGTGIVPTTATPSRFNSQSLAVSWPVQTLNPIVYLGINATDYNIMVESSTSYIVSAYFWSPGTVATNVQLKVKWSNGTTSTVNTMSTTAAGTPAAATRLSGVVTSPAGVTGAVLYVESSTLTALGGWNMDGVQIETKWTGATAPSPWTPPGMTRIDGSMIRTGSIQSTYGAQIWDTSLNNGLGGWKVDASNPVWAINTNGAATFGDLLVRGRVTVGQVGTPSDLDPSKLSTIASGNYSPSSEGFLLRSDGWVEFNRVVTQSLDGAAIKTGTLDATTITSGTINADLILAGSMKTSSTGQRVEIGNFGIKWFDIDDPVEIPSLELPTDTKKSARFTGNIEAQTLTAYNGVSIARIDTTRIDAGAESMRLEPGATMRLAIGIQPPGYTPSTTVYWGSMACYGAPLSNNNQAYSLGTHVDPSGNKYVCYRGGNYTNTNSGGWGPRIAKFNSSGTLLATYTVTVPNIYTTFDNMVVDLCDDDAGGFYCLFRSYDGASNNIAHFDANFNYLGGPIYAAGGAYAMGGSASGGHFLPTGIFKSGTTLYIAGAYTPTASTSGNRTVAMYNYNLSLGTAAFRNSTFTITGSNFYRADANLTTQYSGDLAHGCFWDGDGLHVPYNSGTTHLVKTFSVTSGSTIASSPSTDFIGANYKQIRSVTYGAGTIWTCPNYDISGGAEFDNYSGIMTGASAATWWAGHEWRRVSPAYATGIGNAGAFTMYNRAYYKVSTGAIPYGTDAASADSLSMFVGAGSSYPGPGGMYRMYTGTATAVEFSAAPSGSSTAADARTSFPSGANSKIYSTGVDGSSNPLITLNSDGSGRSGPWAWDQFGNVTARPSLGGIVQGNPADNRFSNGWMQRGTTTYTFSNVQSVSQTINLGGMVQVPTISAICVGTSQLVASISGRSASSFVLTLQHRTGALYTGTVAADWMALAF